MDTEAADVAPNLDNLHIGDDGSDGNDALLDAVVTEIAHCVTATDNPAYCIQYLEETLVTYRQHLGLSSAAAPAPQTTGEGAHKSRMRKTRKPATTGTIDDGEIGPAQSTPNTDQEDTAAKDGKGAKGKDKETKKDGKEADASDMDTEGDDKDADAKDMETEEDGKDADPKEMKGKKHRKPRGPRKPTATMTVVEGVTLADIQASLKAWKAHSEDIHPKAFDIFLEIFTLDNIKRVKNMLAQAYKVSESTGFGTKLRVIAEEPQLLRDSLGKFDEYLNIEMMAIFQNLFQLWASAEAFRTYQEATNSYKQKEGEIYDFINTFNDDEDLRTKGYVEANVRTYYVSRLYDINRSSPMYKAREANFDYNNRLGKAIAMFQATQPGLLLFVPANWKHDFNRAGYPSLSKLLNKLTRKYPGVGMVSTKVMNHIIEPIIHHRAFPEVLRIQNAAVENGMKDTLLELVTPAADIAAADAADDEGKTAEEAEEEAEEDARFVAEDDSEELGDDDSADEDYVDEYDSVRINAEELEALRGGSNPEAGDA